MIFDHDYVGVFPDGAIRHVNDLQYAISAMEGCTVYSVGQSGHIWVYNIPAGAILCGSSGMHYFNCRQKFGVYDKDSYEAKFFLGDNGVNWTNEDLPSHTCHRSFLNLDLAQSYSNWMKNDARYKDNVRAWHRRCDAWNSRI